MQRMVQSLLPKATKRGGEQLKAAIQEAQKRYPDIGDYKQWIEVTDNLVVKKIYIVLLTVRIKTI